MLRVKQSADDFVLKVALQPAREVLSTVERGARTTGVSVTAKGRMERMQ